MKRLAFAILPLLVACSGAGNSYTGHPCPGVIVSLNDPIVAPADGSTGVPTTIGTLRFSRQYDMNQPVTLSPRTAGATIVTSMEPQDDPALNTIDVTVPVLAAHTTYVLSGALTKLPSGSDFCGSRVEYRLGSFTTQ